jgi:hypothetical protein
MRLKGAHAEFGGQGESLVVVGCGGLDVRGIVMCGNLAEQPQGVGLAAALVALSRASCRARSV